MRVEFSPAQAQALKDMRAAGRSILKYADWHWGVANALEHNGCIQNVPATAKRAEKFRLTARGIAIADTWAAREKRANRGTCIQSVELVGPWPKLLSYLPISDDYGWALRVAQYEIQCDRCRTVLRLTVQAFTGHGIPDAPEYCSPECKSASARARARAAVLARRDKRRVAALEREGIQVQTYVPGRPIPMPPPGAPMAAPLAPVPEPEPVDAPADAEPDALEHACEGDDMEKRSASVNPTTTLTRPSHQGRHVEVDGVWWVPKAYLAAQAKGVVDEMSRVARAYLERRGGYAVYPSGDKQRVTIGRHTVVLGDDDVVIAFYIGHHTDLAASVGTVKPARVAGPRAARGTHARGPRDMDELEKWLGEAGYSVGLTGGGHREVTRDGKRVYFMPSTPSDHRSMSNTVAGIRRATGLTLRR